MARIIMDPRLKKENHMGKTIWKLGLYAKNRSCRDSQNRPPAANPKPRRAPTSSVRKRGWRMSDLVVF